MMVIIGIMFLLVVDNNRYVISWYVRGLFETKGQVINSIPLISYVKIIALLYN